MAQDHGQLFSARLLVAGVAWVAAAVGGVAATSGLDHAIGGGPYTAATQTDDPGTGDSGQSSNGSDPTPSPPSDLYQDITSHPPAFPDDDTPVDPDSPKSLFLAVNLEPVLQALAADYGRKANVSQLSIYPGAVEVVFVEEGGSAQLVDATTNGGTQLLKNDTFGGSLSTEYLGDVKAQVPQILVALGEQQPETRGLNVERLVFLPDLTKTDAGIEVDYHASREKIIAELDGTRPRVQTPDGTRMIPLPSS